MSLTGWIKGRLRLFKTRREQAELLRSYAGRDLDLTRAAWPRSLTDPTRFYQDLFAHFHLAGSPGLRAHRRYFTAKRRGFGEDAFHAMWEMLFREFRPASFLEIGVYRGQVISLAALLQKQLEIVGEVVGISPFLPAGDSVSRYRTDVDYEADVRLNFQHFALPVAKLLKVYSTDPAAVDLIRSRRWDCIYIDGNHDHEIAKADWDRCSAAVREGGLIVLDDSALDTAFNPPAFATKGHPGPTRVAQEIDRDAFEEILQAGHNRVFQRRG